MTYEREEELNSLYKYLCVDTVVYVCNGLPAATAA